MNAVQSFFQQLTGQLLGMQWSDLLDIVVVAFLIYRFLPLLRSTGTARIAKVVAVVVVIAWLTDALEMHAMNFLASQLLTVGLIAIVVLFQPELRRMIDHIGSMKLKGLFSTEKTTQDMSAVVVQTVRACVQKDFPYLEV